MIYIYIYIFLRHYSHISLFFEETTVTCLVNEGLGLFGFILYFIFIFIFYFLFLG